MYSEANAAPMVRNFCIVYIEMAFERVQAKVCLFFPVYIFFRKLFCLVWNDSMPF